MPIKTNLWIGDTVKLTPTGRYSHAHGRHNAGKVGVIVSDPQKYYEIRVRWEGNAHPNKETYSISDLVLYEPEYDVPEPIPLRKPFGRRRPRFTRAQERVNSMIRSGDK